jgi:hypothetical protein
MADGAGPVLGAHRLEGLRQRRQVSGLPQQALNHLLGLAVAPLAVPLVAKIALGIDQIMSRPVMVGEALPVARPASSSTG